MWLVSVFKGECQLENYKTHHLQRMTIYIMIYFRIKACTQHADLIDDVNSSQLGEAQ